jgi:HEPN domain-containing protein
LKSARKTVILRESIDEKAEYNYVMDNYLDKDLKVHVNTYSKEDLKSFIESYDYKVEFVEDIYTAGKPQLVIDHYHYWKFLVATKLK